MRSCSKALNLFSLKLAAVEAEGCNMSRSNSVLCSFVRVPVFGLIATHLALLINKENLLCRSMVALNRYGLSIPSMPVCHMSYQAIM